MKLGCMQYRKKNRLGNLFCADDRSKMGTKDMWCLCFITCIVANEWKISQDFAT